MTAVVVVAFMQIDLTSARFSARTLELRDNDDRLKVSNENGRVN